MRVGYLCRYRVDYYYLCINIQQPPCFGLDSNWQSTWLSIGDNMCGIPDRHRSAVMVPSLRLILANNVVLSSMCAMLI